MGKKKSHITFTDMFCGAGGSSQGIRRIADRHNGGVEVKLAMNHWALAIKTHAANFPDTDHDCADISNQDPRRYDSTDMLIASPECTNHSLAKNKKKVKKQLNMFETQQAAEERSRATMWDVPRFAEAHGYNCIITENVVDAKRWKLYDSWLHAMHSLGYSHRECYLNSMHFPPTPQSRDRLYVVFWKKKNRAPMLDYMPLAYCSTCTKDINAFQFWKPGCLPYGKYKTQYVYKCLCGNTVEPYYYAAMNCIDWSIKSERIGDKKRKLKPNTRTRVQIGIDRFWNNPFVIYGGDNKGAGKKASDRTYPVSGPLPTQCAQPWHQLITPFLAYSSNNHGTHDRVSSGLDAVSTQTTTQDAGLMMPPVPFAVDYYGNSGESTMGKELPTQPSQVKHGLVLHPFLTANYTPGYQQPIEKAIGTQVASVHHCIVSPPFITQSAYGGSVIPVNKPLNAQTAQQNFDLVQMPFQIEFNGSGTARSLAHHINTQLAEAKHNAIITNEAWQAFIGYYYGNAYESHITDALGTCTTKERHYLGMFKAGEKIEVDDCYYRMIRAKEVGKAMAFDDGYIVYGDEREQVLQFGNAVTPPVMEWLAQQCVNSLS